MPEWKDAPNSPGLWLGISEEERFGKAYVRSGLIVFRTLEEDQGDYFTRYYGPIPPDRQGEG